MLVVQEPVRDAGRMEEMRRVEAFRAIVARLRLARVGHDRRFALITYFWHLARHEGDLVAGLERAQAEQTIAVEWCSQGVLLRPRPVALQRIADAFLGRFAFDKPLLQTARVATHEAREGAHEEEDEEDVGAAQD